MTAIHVRDLMTADVRSVPRDEPLSNVRLMMLDRGFRHVPVVDGDEVVGIISDRDLLVFMGEAANSGIEEQVGRLEEAVAEDVMSSSVETIDPDEDVSVAADAMLHNKYSCLPVVEGAHLVGILTESDFVRHLGHASKRGRSR